jgi:hypothetical protein
MSYIPSETNLLSKKYVENYEKPKPNQQRSPTSLDLNQEKEAREFVREERG